LPPAFLPRRAIEKNLSDIAALVRAEQPDVVALEELDRRSFWSAWIDHLARIGDEAGYPHRAFVAGRDVARGPFAMREGTGLLAVTPLDDADGLAFHAWPLDDKSFVVATFHPPGLGGVAVDVVSIHLDPFLEPTRRAHVRRTLEALARRAKRPLVVMGDMNASWRGGRGALGDLARGLGLHAYLEDDADDTYPASRAFRRIDWILVSDDLEFASYRTPRAIVSDHRAVVADLRLR
jgi:endonuclease/exonuclease/phosphatase family metal-dependent hydrolase